MVFDFPGFSIVFIIAGVLAVYCATYVYHRRPTPGSTAFTGFALAIAAWVIFRALEAGAIDLGIKIFWGKMEFFGSIPAGLFWAIFCMDYTGIKWWRKPRNLALLVILPLLSLIMVWTNNLHGWFWPNIYPSPGTGGVILVWEHGPAWWVAALTNYAFIIIGGYILLRYLIGNMGMKRWQLIVLLVGTAIPVISNLAFALGFTPVKGLDLTPFAIAVSGLFYAFAFFQLHFLDVVPVARGALVESLPDGIIVTDVGGVVMDVNPAVEKMLGLKKAEQVGKSLESLWGELAGLIKRVKEGGHLELESEKAGSRQWLDISLTPLRDKKQKEVGELIVLRDFTYRRQMERSLRESEARYATLVEQSNEGVLIVQDSEYKFANRTLAEMTGYGVEEIVGKRLPFLIGENDRAIIEERNKKREAGQKEPSTYEVQVVKKSGEVLAVEVSVGMISYEGKIAQIVTARDITERKQTQKKLEELYNAEKVLRGNLQAEIEKRSKYTRALVHELNTPLTSILASGELLESEVEDKTLAALVKNIRRASFNLKQRIDELIELARGEVGMLKINAMPIEIDKVIEEIVSEMKPLAVSKGLEMELEVGEGVGLVLGDRGRLRQVMGNLLSNAIKFTARGRIEIKAGVKGEEVEVEVKDSGRGMSEEQMENLFDPYHRKNNEGQELGGLGIGLALSKMFVELHKGKIEVESQVGKGSTFRFTVPRYKE